MSNQGNQLEQQSTSISSLDEEYLAAQRAAYESILIGRETAQVVQQQGEQLHRAETIADETQYHLDRATRLLKGMTWSGWVNNLFTSLPQIPQQQSSSSSPPGSISTSDTSSGSRMPSLDKYDTIPDSYQHIVQAIKNYHVNVMILQYCETMEQKQTCIQVCNEMYNDAMQLLVQQQQPSSESTKQQQYHQHKLKSLEAYSIELKDDLELIRKQQIIFQSQVIITPKSSPSSNTNHPIAIEQQKKDDLFGRHQSSLVSDNTQSQQQTQQTQQKSPKKTIQEQKQDEHLEILASSLNELGAIAQSLKMGIHEQNDTIEQLDTKSDNIYESSKMVTRRTNRLIQNKSWTTVSNIKQSILFGTVMIRHVDSGKYLSIMGNDVYLVNRFNSISCTFDLYKRRGNNSSNSNSTTSNQIGIKSHSNHKWLGQSFLTGSITCSSTTFGKREEWETDNSSTWTIPTTTTEATTTATSKSTSVESATSTSSSDSTTNYATRLLCVSANWGQGGYVHVKMNENYAIQIGNITLEDSKNAAQWSIILLQQ